MSHDRERHLVKHRIERLQRRLVALLAFDGGEEFRLALETELIGATREAYIAGKRDGLQTASAVRASSDPPSRRRPTPAQPFKPVSDSDVTPTRPIDWVDRGGK